MATLRGDISFRYLKQFFLVYSDFFLDLEHFRVIDYKYKVKIWNLTLNLTFGPFSRINASAPEGLDITRLQYHVPNISL